MMNIQNILNSLIALLKLALDSAYYQQSIPGKFDEEISDIIADLSGRDNKEVEIIANSISGDHGRVLGLFSERMASLAIRQNSIDPVKRGLFALLIYARTEDPRDVLLVLSLLHDAILKVGQNPKVVFNEANTYLNASSLLNDFLKRSEEDKSIDAMGYKESSNDEGFLYARTW